MNEFKKLLIAAVGLSAVVLAGCDVEDECNEAGVCADGGGAGGAGGGAGGAGGVGGGAGGEGGGGVTLDWVIVIDDSAEENMAGTPGADICGIESSCGNAISSQLSAGDGELCDSVREGCSANRADSGAAEDDGDACEAASDPSDYVSLGMGGTLSVQFSANLSGCTITVKELVGNQQEGYEVFVCDSADGSGTCAGNGALGATGDGGDVTVTVP